MSTTSTNTATTPDVVNEQTKSDPRVIYLAIRPNVWGKGFTKQQALDAAIDGDKRARTHHVVVSCTDPWAYINGMGYIVHDVDATVITIAERKPRASKVRR